MKPETAPKVKLLSGILYSDADCLETAFSLLEEKWGPIDYKSESFPFDITDYYVPEMGSPIYRMFVSFEKLITPDQIAQIKLDSNAIEDQLAVDGLRKVNLDTGYLDYDKVVLASAKYNGQKIYLEKGIWADLTLHYIKKHFEPYPWSFPDFKSGLYDDVFLRIRELYKVGRKGDGGL